MSPLTVICKLNLYVDGMPCKVPGGMHHAGSVAKI